MNRRVYIAEVPFVSRDLSVRVHIPFSEEKYELRLGKIGVDPGDRDTVECEIPCRIPWIFPFVRHRNNIGIAHMPPVGVTSLLPLFRRRHLSRIAVQPVGYIDVVKLLSPHHAGEGLSL